jgi:hypothetical protein
LKRPVSARLFHGQSDNRGADRIRPLPRTGPRQTGALGGRQVARTRGNPQGGRDVQDDISHRTGRHEGLQDTPHSKRGISERRRVGSRASLERVLEPPDIAIGLRLTPGLGGAPRSAGVGVVLQVGCGSSRVCGGGSSVRLEVGRLDEAPVPIRADARLHLWGIVLFCLGIDMSISLVGFMVETLLELAAHTRCNGN